MASRLEDDEYPPKIDLRKDIYRPLPVIPPSTVDVDSMNGDEASKQALAVLKTINLALKTDDAAKLASCFYPGQAFWRDMLALTAHLRTFKGPEVIATAFLETKKLRNVTGGLHLDRPAKFIPATPVLRFIDCGIVFHTSSPAAKCHGRVVLLPCKFKGEDDTETTIWKIWIFNTRIADLDVQKEDETLLESPGRSFDGGEEINADVLIIGGGSSAITLAVRLKALGVDYIMIDKAAKHPYLLKKGDVAAQLRRYVEAFDLNIINETTVQSSSFDQMTMVWTVKLLSRGRSTTLRCKQLVQATGFGSSKPFTPELPGVHSYKGVCIHSAEYKNAHMLAEQGVESVLVVGSANTAFDILEDCHNAGLKTIINARSPTYIVPFAYLTDIHGLGAYDHMPISVADDMLMTLPTALDGQLIHGLFGHLASMEPPLAEAGFPVIDSRHPDADIQHHLIERLGGHYVEVGEGVNLIADGKAAVRGNVEQTAYTETGVRFSDSSTIDTDAIIWCTGFADINARVTAAEVLGHNADAYSDGTNGEDGDAGSKTLLGPLDVAARLDATWGVDDEGEVRGMWKRQLRMKNYWVMGGNIQHQRWWSRILAQQIKMALEGILPPAYLGTPR